MNKLFTNKDEQGVETDVSVTGNAASAAKTAVKSAASQLGISQGGIIQDIVNQLYGVAKPQEEEQGLTKDPVAQVMKLYGGKTTASQKAGTNLRNPIVAQAVIQRRQQQSKSMTPEKINDLDLVRQRLFNEWNNLQPQPKQPEESIAEKNAREEEEKKQKKKQEMVIEQKKKEDLVVVQKQRSAEREKGWGAG